MWHEKTMKVASCSASFRADTEDRFAVHALADGLVVVVADGAGGIPGGAAAADSVLRLVRDAVIKADFTPYEAAVWVELLRHADAIVEADPACGETTAVIVAVREGGPLVGSSCGDSGAIMVGEDGAIDEMTMHQHRKRRLGSGRAAPVTFERTRLDGTLVVATDGLFAFARLPDIAGAAVRKPLDQAAEVLIELVRTPRIGDLIDDGAVVLVWREL
jgi:hypothetical protein